MTKKQAKHPLNNFEIQQVIIDALINQVVTERAELAIVEDRAEETFEEYSVLVNLIRMSPYQGWFVDALKTLVKEAPDEEEKKRAEEVLDFVGSTV